MLDQNKVAGLIQSLSLSPGSLVKNDGWIVIGNRTGKSGGGTLAASTTYSILSDRMEFVSPWHGIALKTVRGSWYVGTYGESAFPNDLFIRESLVFQGPSYPNASTSDYGLPFYFNNSQLGLMRRGNLLMSDPMYVGIASNTRYFIHTAQSCAVATAPPNPTVTLSSNSSSVGSGKTGFFSIAYVFPNGAESLASGGVSAITTSGTQSFQIASPSSISGAIGYTVNYNVAASGINVAYYDSPSGVVPFGQPATISNGPQNTGFLRSVLMPATLGSSPAAYLLTNTGQTAGGTGPGASNNGEGLVFNQDFSNPGSLISGVKLANTVRPQVLLIKCPDGVKPSVALVGDSIEVETAESGYSEGFGGYVSRAVANQAYNMGYSTTIVPLYGRVSVATGGETANTWASQTSWRRYQLATMCTHAIINLGTNDCGSASGGSAVIANNLLTVHNKFLSQDMYTIQLTILPRATSNNFYIGANGVPTDQTITGTHECDRRPLNNWIMDMAGASSITNESMFRAQATINYTTNPYNGGDGSTTKFTTKYPFATNTESVFVQGAFTTSYTYYGIATISNIQYASGVIFGSAPSLGSSVVINYTKIPGMSNLLNNVKFDNLDLTVSSGIEIDNTGAIAFGGGFCRLKGATKLGIATVIGGTSSTIAVSAAGWSTDLYRGYSVGVTSDPNNQGFINPIKYNTASVNGIATLTLLNSFTGGTLANGSTFIIFESPRQFDGVHPTSYDHMSLAQALLSYLTTNPLSWP